MINPISLLFAPYFIFIETFYPSSFEQKETYDATNKSLSSHYNISFTYLLFGFVSFYSFFIHEKIDTIQ
jgi:hypothetical protein